MSEIVIKLAEKADETSVTEFLKSHFMMSNPLRDAYVGGSEESSDLDFSFDDSKEYNLMAIEESSSKLVGIASLLAFDKEKHKEMSNFLENPGDSMDNDIMKFCFYIETKSDVLNRFKIDKALEIQVVSIHPDYRCRGFAGKLFEASIEFAKSRRFEFVTVLCTSSYTMRIAERLKMECIEAVTFDEYNERVGRKVFEANAGNDVAKMFVKKL